MGGNGVGSGCRAADLYPFREGDLDDLTGSGRARRRPGRKASPAWVHTAAGVTRRAGYGAAPPASRVAARSLPRRPAAALDPGASAAPDSPTAGARPGGLPPWARGARSDDSTDESTTGSPHGSRVPSTGFAGLPGRRAGWKRPDDTHAVAVRFGAATATEPGGPNACVSPLYSTACWTCPVSP